MTRPRPVSQPDTVGGRSERTGHPRGFRDPTRPEAQSGRRSRSTPSFQQLLGLSTHCPPGREPVTAAPLPTGLPQMQEATLPLPAAGGHCLPQPADHGTPHCHGHGGPRPWQAALALCRVLREPENAGSGAGVPRNAHGGFTRGSGRLPEDARPGAQCGSIRVRLSRPPPRPGWRTQTAERPGTETWALAAVAEQESGLRMRPRKGSHTSRGWSQDGGAGGAARWHTLACGGTRPHVASRGLTRPHGVAHGLLSGPGPYGLASRELWPPPASWRLELRGQRIWLLGGTLSLAGHGRLPAVPTAPRPRPTRRRHELCSDSRRR